MKTSGDESEQCVGKVMQVVTTVTVYKTNADEAMHIKPRSPCNSATLLSAPNSPQPQLPSPLLTHPAAP